MILKWKRSITLDFTVNLKAGDTPGNKQIRSHHVKSKSKPAHNRPVILTTVDTIVNVRNR